MVLDNLQSMDALFGMTQTGGKPKTRKTAKTGKTVKKAVKAGTKKAVKGGVAQYSCFCLNPTDDAGMIANIQSYQAQKQSSTEEEWATEQARKEGIIQGGMSKMQYKAYLAKMEVKRLYKIAKGKGIKITKKKDGKTTYIKKDTVIQKLCDAMHGKKK